MDAPQVSEKDKKQDILDAYYSLLDQVQGGEESDKKQTTAKLKQTADNLRTVLKKQIDDLGASVYASVDDIMSKVDEVATSLSKLFETRELERQKWERERDEEKKSRQRETEEYNYDVKRSRQLDEDAWNDKKEKREGDLIERDAKLKEAEAELKELRDKDKTFEARLSKGVSDAVSANSAKLQQEFSHKEEMFNAQSRAEIKLLQAKVESLMDLVAGQKAEIELLNKQNDSANQRLTEIASGAVRNFRPGQEVANTNQEIKKQ
ncbi:hypothetical protein COT50_04560 [candidate division WWE3 bacterium CG08_land_8_20_14_0_20_41_10]|uniref:Uncharacterized protein n=1 Tax=candidate division WWE3 bacterium CG08_land_8_20_14_0_20_41_10 TaxID=1975085 RepID=A0A2H0XAW1_UNCKA|nr:MAG: hypothetical protein COT50_04560 [candidate division WWE3 bacterium CG08_land_8_20_14_0_20_41_10]